VIVTAPGEADRGVDEQHPLPAEAVGEHPAEQHADRAAGAGDRAPHAERLVALSALGEHVGHDRQRRRGEQCAAEALDRAGGDQLALGLRQAAEERGDREQHETGDEHAPPAEQVGHAATEEEKAAERQHVGVDHPREVLGLELEILADRRQGDVDDGCVEDDDELRRGEQRESEPLAVAGCVG
jgi:hypothetical protein